MEMVVLSLIMGISLNDILGFVMEVIEMVSSGTLFEDGRRGVIDS